MANENRQMTGIMDYIRWRGDLPVSAVPWCPIDSLLLAVMTYQDMPGCETKGGMLLKEVVDSLVLKRDVQAEKDRMEMIRAMAESRRFGGMRLCLQVAESDADRSIQFSAVTCLIEEGPVVVAYRGTDHTLVGWKEDFMMSYISPVPAQAEALAYLVKAAEVSDAPIVLTGHSKGGNLASYAGAHAAPEIQKRIMEVASFDGPGLDDATIDSEGYSRIRPVLDSFIPNGSVVGLLMNYHKNYQIVRSSTVGLFQHDPFTWGILGPAFIRAEDTTMSSQLIDETVHEWLATCSPDMLEDFVQTMFTTLEKLYANRGEEDLLDIQAAGVVEAAAYVQKLKPEVREQLGAMMGRLLEIAKDTYIQKGLQKNLQTTLDSISQRLRSFGDSLQQIGDAGKAKEKESDSSAD